MILIQGKGVSTGVAIGPLYFYQRAKATIDRYEGADADAEWQRFKAAQQKAMDQLGELAEKVGLTPANLSILKTGKARAVRFSTLEAICHVLGCQPGDILAYQEEE